MLNPDFKDILSCLKNEEAEFMIVGAYALAAHGLPRATGDIDIWVRPNSENAGKVLRALAAFGAPVSDLAEQDFTTPAMVVQFGVEPCRIDILTSRDGVEFDDAWKNKLSVIVDGIEVQILSRPDLLRNKLASGREKDQSDIAWLQKQ